MNQRQDRGNADSEVGEGSSEHTEEGREAVVLSNACAICLEEFEEGENIVRSVVNKECPHVFHETCLKELITESTRKGKYSISCPCCRQIFVETGNRL